MSQFLKGIIHVHSDFSSDGMHSVADLADFARESGFRFVGLTDHAEDLSPDDMQSLRKECKVHSDESCLMIPGLEFRCTEDIHILGLGITKDIISTDPNVVAREIQARGGLAILAHPGRNGFQCPPELCRVLNGIEIWNASDDGRFVPPLTNLHFLQEARRSNVAISAFGGADLHWVDNPPGVTIELQAKADFPVKPEMVLDCLRSGKFVVRGRYVAFDAHPMPSIIRHISLAAFRRCYDVAVAVQDVALGKI